MAAALTPIKVDQETDQLISHASHFLGRSKKSVVDEAVRNFVDAHKTELKTAVQEALRQLDGSTQSAVSLLTGFSSEELEELGGFSDN